MIGARGHRRVRWMLVSACLTLLSLPTATTYTHLFGEQVSMRIDRCEHQTRFYECHGSWTDVDGKRHTTTVSHVGPKDIGRTVEARLGPWPMNAHAGSLWADAPIFLPVALMAIGVPGYLFLRWRFGREVKETARRLLDAPDHFLVLEVNHAGAVRPDGEEHLRTRSGDPELPVPAWASRYRAAPKSNRSKWTTPHQGKRECARRMRQMAKGTHGYQRTNEFTPSPSLRVDGSIDPYSA